MSDQRNEITEAELHELEKFLVYSGTAIATVCFAAFLLTSEGSRIAVYEASETVTRMLAIAVGLFAGGSFVAILLSSLRQGVYGEQQELATDGGQALDSEEQLKQQESFEVRIDGETIWLFNRVNVKKTQLGEVLNGYGTTETFDSEVELGGGDAPETPEAVTHWAAGALEREFGIDAEDRGIRVVDPTIEGVTVL